MKKLALILLLITVMGCSSVRIPDYIKADHPYVRKISGDYSVIISAIKLIFSKKGWEVQKEVNPSEYERREGGEDQSKDVLMFTVPKQYFKVLYSTYTHWNIYVHANADGAEIDLRYEAVTPGPIKQSDLRNDKLANQIFDEIEDVVESK